MLKNSKLKRLQDKKDLMKQALVQKVVKEVMYLKRKVFGVNRKI